MKFQVNLLHIICFIESQRVTKVFADAAIVPKLLFPAICL